MIWRCAEGAGIGAVLGAAVALAAIGLLAWRSSAGDNAIAASIVLISLGGLAGFLASLRRLPTLLNTAIDVDRQLGAPDLLSSALSLLTRGDSPRDFTDAAFAATVLAIADARVRDVTISRLVARRFGPRAWAAIGLAIAGAFTIAAMTSSSSPTIASADRTAAAASSSTWRDRDRPPEANQRSLPPAAVESADRAPDRSGRDEASEDSASRFADRDSSANARARGSADATGSGRAGDDVRRAQFDSTIAPKIETLPAAPSDPRASVAGGTGAAASDSSRRSPEALTAETAPGNVRSTPSTSAPPSPPWESPNWDADRARALQLLDRVPDRYRDIVRDYFTR